MNAELIERLAAIAHAVWADWMRYMLNQCENLEHDTGDIFLNLKALPPRLVTQWERQASTPYEGLTEGEKESDRAIANLYLEAMGPILPVPNTSEEAVKLYETNPIFKYVVDLIVREIRCYSDHAESAFSHECHEGR